jgi:hypothetical protein
MLMAQQWIAGAPSVRVAALLALFALANAASAAPGGTATTRFLLSDLDLRDPHFFVNAIVCRDVTDTPLLGFSVNGQLQAQIQGDADGDGFLDLSNVIEFLPLDQAAASNPSQIGAAVCTAPLAGTQCGDLLDPTPATATLAGTGTCLGTLAGTTRPYTPAITAASAACFASSTISVTLDLAGVPVTLRDAQYAATFSDSPATALGNGLLRGFISEADANLIILPATLPLIGGQTLASLLPGGTGNCAAFSDKDINLGVVGWWFYLNFPAVRIADGAGGLFGDGFEDVAGR